MSGSERDDTEPASELDAADEQSGAGESASGDGNNSTMYDDDDEEVLGPYQMSFSSYQIFLFVTCYIAYCILLYNRKSFSFSLQYVIVDHYFSSTEVGMILSAQTTAYAISKFFFSWVADHYSPRDMFAGGLFFSGFVMLAFTDQDDWANIMLLTAANGLAQGMGWPAVSKMVRSWFPPTQFGLWYAVLSTAANLLAALGPNIANALAASYGWRWGMQIPAIVAMTTALIIPFSTWDAPSDVGYEDQLTMIKKLEGHWSDIAGSEFMMFVSATYFMLHIVKTGCQDWGVLYLTQERQISAHLAHTYLTSMEIGGLFGCIALGIATDFMVRRGYYVKTGRSPRMNVVQFCLAGCCLFMNLFLFIDKDISKAPISFLGFLMGMCMYGAISLLGTIAVEVAPIHMTGCVNGAIGLAASLGVMASGAPINFIAHSWDWFTAFMCINLVCILAFIIIVLGKDSHPNFVPQGGPRRLTKKFVRLKKKRMTHFSVVSTFYDPLY